MLTYTKRQIEIIEAATQRINQYGIQNLTIKTLAEDIGISEPGLYRHFKNKNDILLEMLNFYNQSLKNDIEDVLSKPYETESEALRAMFKTQLDFLHDNPAVASIIYSESIFQYDTFLNQRVCQSIETMHSFVAENIVKGIASNHYKKDIDADTITTILIGGIRLTVLRWRIDECQVDLLTQGMDVIESVLKMIEV